MLYTNLQRYYYVKFVSRRRDLSKVPDTKTPGGTILNKKSTGMDRALKKFYQKRKLTYYYSIIIY